MIGQFFNGSRLGWRRILIAALPVAFLSACLGPTTQNAPIVVTIPPLKLILQEIAGEAGEIACILPPGASPHTFEMRPSAARLLADAKAVFYVDESIDGWVVQAASSEKIAVFPLVPPNMALALVEDHIHAGETAHAHNNGQPTTALNAHFWSDPLLVRELVPALVAELARLEPERADQFSANGDVFMEKLAALDKSIQEARPELSDYGLVAFHPSWDYFFHRYDIAVTAYIEPFPGKEPTPRAIQDLQEAMEQHAHRVVLSETQLPSKPAHILAEALNAEVTVIDPLGGDEGQDSFDRFLSHNANLLWEALR